MTSPRIQYLEGRKVGAPATGDIAPDNLEELMLEPRLRSSANKPLRNLLANWMALYSARRDSVPPAQSIKKTLATLADPKKCPRVRAAIAKLDGSPIHALLVAQAHRAGLPLEDWSAGIARELARNALREFKDSRGGRPEGELDQRFLRALFDYWSSSRSSPDALDERASAKSFYRFAGNVFPCASRKHLSEVQLRALGAGLISEYRRAGK